MPTSLTLSLGYLPPPDSIPHTSIVVVDATIDEEICLHVTVTRYVETFSSLSTPNKKR